MKIEDREGKFVWSSENVGEGGIQTSSVTVGSTSPF